MKIMMKCIFLIIHYLGTNLHDDLVCLWYFFIFCGG